MSMEAKLLEAGEEGGATAGGFCKLRQRKQALVAVFALTGLATFGVLTVGSSSTGIAMSASSSKYTKVQYLGLQLFTTPGTTADGCFSNHLTSMDECYLGNPTADRDLEARLNIMMTTLENAYASPHWDRSNATLKVFVAPEFYWRGARGAYRLGIAGHALSNTMVTLFRKLGEPRWNDWLIAPGTVILAEEADPKYELRFEDGADKISYFNVLPIVVGGTERVLFEFKHYISGIDFIQSTPKTVRTQPVSAAPGAHTQFCKDHPQSNGCIYNKLPVRVLHHFGIKNFEYVHQNVFTLEGLRIGVEVCLDHKMGRLVNHLGSKTVDLHFIASAGMNIGFGPIGVPAGGPTFLSDGYAQTSVSLNEFGGGRQWAMTPAGTPVYNVGLIYEGDPLISLQAWLGDAFSAITGTAFGTNAAGRHGLAGGSQSVGSTGVSFQVIPALGNSWREQLDGYFNTADYDLATKMYAEFDKTVRNLEKGYNVHHKSWTQLSTAYAYPTIDIYGPFLLRK